MINIVSLILTTTSRMLFILEVELIMCCPTTPYSGTLSPKLASVYHSYGVSIKMTRSITWSSKNRDKYLYFHLLIPSTLSRQILTYALIFLAGEEPFLLFVSISLSVSQQIVISHNSVTVSMCMAIKQSSICIYSTISPENCHII